MADTFIEDDTAWPTMVRLAGCLCMELEKRQLPGTCECAVVPGPLAVIDSCGECKKAGVTCGGQAWVRLSNEYPSSSFPSASQDEGNCNAPMAYVLEIGVARCLKVGKSNAITGFVQPTMEQKLEDTRLQMADKRAMRAAIQCCMDDGDVTYVLGNYTPMQATGDCGGGFWTVTIWEA